MIIITKAKIKVKKKKKQIQHAVKIASSLLHSNSHTHTHTHTHWKPGLWFKVKDNQEVPGSKANKRAKANLHQPPG